MATAQVTVTRKALEEANKTIIYDKHDEQHVASTVVYSNDGRHLYFDKECTVPLYGDTLVKLYLSNTMVIEVMDDAGIHYIKPNECSIINDGRDVEVCAAVFDVDGTVLQFACGGATLIEDEPETENKEEQPT